MERPRQPSRTSRKYDPFSADVESLYPSIPWSEGIASATRFYGKNYFALIKEARKKRFLPPPNPRLFREMLKLVLENNFFHFQNSSWHHQTSGTAMGCSISVRFANTFLYLRSLGRYIDDLIGVWTGEPDIIPNIFLRTVDEKIRLTYVIRGEQLEALDLILFLSGTNNNKRVKTKIFRKPTDGHLFLHWRSAHPLRLKKSIPYAQLLRLKRNCSDAADFETASSGLLKRFLHRGYSKPPLQKAFRKCTLKTSVDFWQQESRYLEV